MKSADNISAQVEVKVGTECKTEVLTSAVLSKIYNQPTRVIAVMDFGTALANKMSAWLDRRLMRDLYDIHFLLNMGIKPDLETLIQRLKKPAYAKGVIHFPGKPPLEIKAFYGFLKEETLKISDKNIAGELSDILTEQERTGLAMRIKASITSRV